MRCLLLVLTLAAVSAIFEAAPELQQNEKGVHVSNPEDAEESRIVLQPIVFTLQPQGDEKAFIIGTPKKEEERPIIIVRPEKEEGDSMFILNPAQDEEAKRIARSNNISMGTIGLRDFLLAHYTPQVQAVANQVVIQDVRFQGVFLIRISFIRAIQTSGQLATARIIAGGLGMNFVTIRLTSARGSGFQYSIDIWGH